MKKKNLTLPLIIASVLFFVVTAFASLNNDSLSKISLSEKEIPEGFFFGKIPPFAKKVLKNNPWTLDKPAIRKLTDRIYPGGNYNNITAIHMTIMAKKKTPYGDDIVCYLILFKEGKSATDEIENNMYRIQQGQGSSNNEGQPGGISARRRH